MSTSVEVKPEGSEVLQLIVMLQNRVGTLCALLDLVDRSGENVIGLSMQDSHDATIVRLLVTDPDMVRAFFFEKGITHNTSKVIVVCLEESSDDLIKCLQVLRKAETEVNFMYSLLAHPKGKNLVAMYLEDYDFGLELLHRAGFKLYFQEDLSR